MNFEKIADTSFKVALPGKFRDFWKSYCCKCLLPPNITYVLILCKTKIEELFTIFTSFGKFKNFRNSQS